MMKSSAYILMDVGGTFIKSGVMTAGNVLVEGTQQTVAIDSNGSKEEIINSLTVADMGRLAGEGDPTALEVFRRVGSFIGQNIKDKLMEYNIRCLMFGGQISRSLRYLEDAVKEELAEIEGLEIRTVSDFSNAAFMGLVAMLEG